jgi:hypothetical protein
MKKCIVFLFIFVCTAAYTNAQDAPSYFSFNLTPGVNIPVGRDTDFYSIGGGLVLTGEYRFPSLPLLYVSGNVGYDVQQVEFDTSLSIVSFGAGGGQSDFLCSKMDVSVNREL